jgi:hypothetical protein
LSDSHLTITATFDDLEGDVPTAEGAGGQDRGSAKTDSKGKANKKTGRETRCMLSKTIVLTNELYILDSKVSCTPVIRPDHRAVCICFRYSRTILRWSNTLHRNLCEILFVIVAVFHIKVNVMLRCCLEHSNSIDSCYITENTYIN